MLRDTRKLPQPREESDEPIIAAEGRYVKKKDASGLGEYIGQQRKRELEQIESRKKATEASVANQAFIAMEKNAAIDYQRTRAKRSAADQAALHPGTQGTVGSRRAAAGAGASDDDEKEDGLLKSKFDHAKVELDKQRHKEESVVNKLRNEVKALESSIISAKTERKRGGGASKLGEKQVEDLERKMKDFEHVQQELKSKAGKLTPKEKSELSMLRSQITDLSFKIRLKEKATSAGASRVASSEATLDRDQAEVKKKLAEVGEHESRLSQIEDLLRRQQSEKSKKGSSLEQAWRMFDADLRKLGIHVYR